MDEPSDGEVQTIFHHHLIKKNICWWGGLGNEKASEEFVVNLSGYLKDCKRILCKKGSFCLDFRIPF